MGVHLLGWEDPLEEDMATHSSILAWRIPWTEEPGRLQSIASQRVRNQNGIRLNINKGNDKIKWNNVLRTLEKVVPI